MPDYDPFIAIIINSKYENKYINKFKKYYNDMILYLIIRKFLNLILMCLN